MSRPGYNRLDAYWRPHLATLADLVVAAGENKAAAVRRINDRFGLPKTLANGHRVGAFTAGKLARWLASPEFAAHVQEAKRRAAEGEADAPATRSARFRQFAKAVAERCEREHAEAEKALADADAKSQEAIQARAAMNALEGKIVGLRKAERDEEKHAEDLARRRAERDMKTFVRNLLALVKEIDDPVQLKRELAELARRPGRLLEGIE